MSLSKPCVVTDAGGNPEIIQHQYNGLVTENNDATKFATAINHLLANSSLFDEMANNRLKVILKGTYASTNSTSPWQWDYNDLQDDSIDDITHFVDTNDTVPTVFMIDIAELSIVDYNNKNQSKFGHVDDKPYRYLFEFDLADDNEFFNGTGVFDLLLRRMVNPDAKDSGIS